MEIISKAYQVYHEGMLNENPHEGYRMKDLPIYYAETPGQAKNICSEIHDHYIDGEPHKFTDLKVKRAKNADVVLFEGNKVKRGSIKRILENRERVNRLTSLPDDEYFYVQDARSYVGNAVLWWGLNSSGYVTDPKKAHKYTKEEIVKKFSDGRDTDIIWPASHVESAIKEFVDIQGLNREYCV